MTVPELCVYTHNFFDRADDPVAGEFAFEPDTVPAGVVPGQYFLVCGSIFNDGVHKAGGRRFDRRDLHRDGTAHARAA